MTRVVGPGLDQLSSLVFAVVSLSIFLYGLAFSMNLFAGNGGKYWGFNGLRSPVSAAEKSFYGGDWRFLAYELDKTLGGDSRAAPQAYRCDIHNPAHNGHLRFNGVAAMHGYDSIDKAHRFAMRYNEIMIMHLYSETDAFCEPRGIE